MPTTPYEKIHGMHGDIYVLGNPAVKLIGINSVKLRLEISSKEIVDFSCPIDAQGNVWVEQVKGPARGTVSGKGYLLVHNLLTGSNISLTGLYPGQGYNVLRQGFYGMNIFIIRPGLFIIGDNPPTPFPGLGYWNLKVFLRKTTIDSKAKADEPITINFEGKLDSFSSQPLDGNVQNNLRVFMPTAPSPQT